MTSGIRRLRILEQPFKEARSIPLGWAYSNLDHVDVSGRMMTRSVLDTVPNAQHPKRDVLHCLGCDMFVLPGASIISRSAFDSVVGFDEQFVGYEDDDLFLRLLCGRLRQHLHQRTTDQMADALDVDIIQRENGSITCSLFRKTEARISLTSRTWRVSISATTFLPGSPRPQSSNSSARSPEGTARQQGSAEQIRYFAGHFRRDGVFRQ